MFRTLKINHTLPGTLLIGCLGMMMGCAAAAPAEQLVEAKKTYDQAQSGKAAEYAPDDLLEAENLLERAANAENGSPLQQHLAYLADRQARLASANGTIEYYEDTRNEAQQEYIARIEKRREEAQEALASTREELERVATKMKEKDADVENLRERKRELEQRKDQLQNELSAKEAALTKSEQARREAQQRAEAAIASLNELANVKEEAHETVITLSGSVLFKTGEAELLPIAKNKLSKVSNALKNLDEDKKIVVEGHTDSRGSAKMNKELSQKRAESVTEYLAQEGIPQSRLKAVGKGEEEPVADNDSPEGRANNRRVELRILEKPQSTPAQKQASK